LLAFSSEFRRGQALLDGVLGELCDRIDLQLVRDPQPVCVDGLRADIQPQGNLLGGRASVTSWRISRSRDVSTENTVGSVLSSV